MVPEHGPAGGPVLVRAIQRRGRPVHGVAGGQAPRGRGLAWEGGRDLLGRLGRRAPLAVVGMGFATGDGWSSCRKTSRTVAGDPPFRPRPSGLNCISRA